jgi:PAS domain S-box-containing protein
MKGDKQKKEQTDSPPSSKNGRSINSRVEETRSMPPELQPLDSGSTGPSFFPVPDVIPSTSDNDLLHAAQTKISRDAIVSTDRQLNIVAWNGAAESLFGWRADEILGKPASREVLGQVLEVLNHDEVIKQITERGSWKGEAVSLKKDGSRLNSSLSIDVLWNEAGNFDGIVSIFCETSSLRQIENASGDGAELELKASERIEQLVKMNRMLQLEVDAYKQAELSVNEFEGKNRDLVDNIKLGIFRSTPGPKGRFLEVNKAMETITGYSRAELLKIDVNRLYVNASDRDIFQNEVAVADWKATWELNLRRKDGSEITVSETVVTIRYESGSILFFDGILEDINERKQSQQQVQQSLQRLQKTIKEIIQAMAYIGEIRDPYTAGHQRRVAQISFEIAKIMGLNESQFEGLTMAAFVHDIGKIYIPSDILSKPGKLTKLEFDLLKEHTRTGHEILKTIEFPWPIAQIVLQHHERLNGSGYPFGIPGEDIVIEAKILAVADVVEAMSSHRPYRPALGIDQALAEIKQYKGVLYDSDAVDACVKLFTDNSFQLN